MATALVVGVIITLLVIALKGRGKKGTTGDGSGDAGIKKETQKETQKEINDRIEKEIEMERARRKAERPDVYVPKVAAVRDGCFDLGPVESTESGNVFASEHKPLDGWATLVSKIGKPPTELAVPQDGARIRAEHINEDLVDTLRLERERETARLGLPTGCPRDYIELGYWTTQMGETFDMPKVYERMATAIKDYKEGQPLDENFERMLLACTKTTGYKHVAFTLVHMDTPLETWGKGLTDANIVSLGTARHQAREAFLQHWKWIAGAKGIKHDIDMKDDKTIGKILSEYALDGKGNVTGKEVEDYASRLRRSVGCTTALARLQAAEWLFSSARASTDGPMLAGLQGNAWDEHLKPIFGVSYEQAVTQEGQDKVTKFGEDILAQAASKK